MYECPKHTKISIELSNIVVAEYIEHCQYATNRVERTYAFLKMNVEILHRGCSFMH